jgi:alkylation response protein AidB-like acyl-CoA dehydrogenase
VYGVWASRSAGTGLAAQESAEGWRLRGQLRFASGAGLIDRALVPGWTDPDRHRLFDISVGGLVFDESSWASPGMDASRSLTCDLVDHPGGEPVGGVDFYLDRPGFVAGGLGPAAVWLGGADQVADLVVAGLQEFPATAQQVWRLGRMQQAISMAEAEIVRAVRVLDAGPSNLAAEVASARTAAAQAADVVLVDAPVIVGPGGLSRSGRLARALADLAMYVRQHHLDKELEAAGRRALDTRQVLGS